MINLPKVSEDAQKVKIIDSMLYPYLKIDINSVIIDLDKIRS